MISEAGVKIQKFKLHKKNLKDILNIVKPIYKSQAIVTISNKRSALCKKVLECVSEYFYVGGQKILIFFLHFDFFGTPFNFFFTLQPRIYLLFGLPLLKSKNSKMSWREIFLGHPVFTICDIQFKYQIIIWTQNPMKMNMKINIQDQLLEYLN